MTESPHDVVLPLRDRMPDYLAVFGIGWAVVILVGLLVGVFSSASLPEGVGYVALGSGLVLLLAGGATGGGYANLGLGAAGALFGSRQRHDDDFDDPDIRRGVLKKVNATDRLRRGLRPEKNPRAFWQVVAGFVNLAAGYLLVTMFAG